MYTVTGFQLELEMVLLITITILVKRLGWANAGIHMWATSWNINFMGKELYLAKINVKALFFADLYDEL